MKLRHEDGERGFVMVMFALSIVALLIVAALVLDGSQGYSNRREQQTAADLSTLAATKKLYDAMFFGGSAAAIQAEAVTVATKNGANPALVRCTLITADKAPRGACSSYDPTDNSFRDVVGTMVNAGKSQDTAFGNVAGQSKVTVRTVAASTIQPLVGADSPFLVCNGQPPMEQKKQYDVDDSDPDNPTKTKIVPPESQPTLPPILRRDGNQWVINPAAVGVAGDANDVAGVDYFPENEYVIHDADIQECGAQGNKMKGLADDTGRPFYLPARSIPFDQGDKAGPTRAQVAGQPGCTQSSWKDFREGCVLLVPVCTGPGYESEDPSAEPDPNNYLQCEGWAAFKLIYADANTHIGRLLPRALVTNGYGGTGPPQRDGINIVQLIE